MQFGKATLITIFAASLATANIVASKLAFFQLPIVGGVAVPAGFVGLGVGFLCTDLLSELYGKETARAAVNGTVVALIVAYGLVYAALVVPVAPFYRAHEAYVTTLSSSSNIVAASVVTIVISQNIDVSIFHAIRGLTDVRAARNLGSTVVSQLVDTTLFILLGFVVLPSLLGGSVTSLTAAASLIVGQYIVKLLLALLDTPVFSLVSELDRRGLVDAAPA